MKELLKTLVALLLVTGLFHSGVARAQNGISHSKPLPWHVASLTDHGFIAAPAPTAMHKAPEPTAIAYMLAGATFLVWRSRFLRVG